MTDYCTSLAVYRQVFVSVYYFLANFSLFWMIILQSISGYFSKPGTQVCFDFSQIHYLYQIAWDLIAAELSTEVLNESIW